MKSTAPPTNPSETNSDSRLRERLLEVTAAWRYLDDWLFDYLDTKEPLTSRTEGLARHRQRMAEALDQLEQDWILRHGGGR